jgi:hypothetical protein
MTYLTLERRTTSRSAQGAPNRTDSRLIARSGFVARVP